MEKKSQNPQPEWFRYQADVVPVEEWELVAQIQKLSVKEFEFHGYAGKRRTISFGWHNDFADSKLRLRAAAFAELSPEDPPQALVTEYSPGTAFRSLHAKR